MAVPCSPGRPILPVDLEGGTRTPSEVGAPSMAWRGREGGLSRGPLSKGMLKNAQVGVEINRMSVCRISRSLQTHLET